MGYKLGYDDRGVDPGIAHAIAIPAPAWEVDSIPRPAPAPPGKDQMAELGNQRATAPIWDTRIAWAAEARMAFTGMRPAAAKSWDLVTLWQIAAAGGIHAVIGHRLVETGHGVAAQSC